MQTPWVVPNMSDFQGPEVVAAPREEDADGNDDEEEAGEEEKEAEGLAETSKTPPLSLFPTKETRRDPFHHQVRTKSSWQSLFLAAVPRRSCSTKAGFDLAWV